jgi:hypothetical protein
MKISHYLLGITLLISGIDSIFTTKTGCLYACPRCRRALPKGPLKRPYPAFPKKERNQPYSLHNAKENSSEQVTKEKLNEQK